MNTRRLVRAVSCLLTGLALGLSINACSAAPDAAQGDSTAATSEAVMTCGLFELPSCQLHRTPVCQCEVPTGAVCTQRSSEICGAALNPPAPGCTRGQTIITNNATNPPVTVDVWVCTDDTTPPQRIEPWHIGDAIETLDATQPFCSPCVGPIDPGYYFLLHYHKGAIIGGGCSGPCALGVGR